MSDLTKSIQALYQDRISQETAEIASGNLVEFFRVLQGVDERLQRNELYPFFKQLLPLKLTTEITHNF